MKTLRIVKLLEYPYVCKITIIPLGLLLTEKHDDLILYDVCHDYISVAWGHGLYYGGSVLVAMPQLSDLVALPHISVLVAMPRLFDLVALPHISVLVALPQYLYLVTSSQYLAASLRFLWCVAVGWVE